MTTRRKPSGPWCPTCRQDTATDTRGRCLWCDAKTITLDGAQVIFPKRGCTPLLTDHELRHAADLYYRGGMSLRAIGRALLDSSGYASARGLGMALSAQFRMHGWPVQDRIEATVRASLKHGLSRRGQEDPEHRHRMRVARGEIRGVRCEAVKTQHPRKGERCQRPALSGGRFCDQHEPSRRAEVAADAARMRAHIGSYDHLLRDLP